MTISNPCDFADPVPCGVNPAFTYTRYPCDFDDPRSGDTRGVPIIIDLQTPVKAEVVNRHREVLLAIEAELGIQPSGTYTTVRSRLDSLEATLCTIWTSLEGLTKVNILSNGVSVVDNVQNINFFGPGVLVTDAGDFQANINIIGGGLPDVLSINNTTDGYDIDFINDSRGVNCLDPVNPQDVATKNYVDEIANYFDGYLLTVQQDSLIIREKVSLLNFTGPGVTATEGLSDGEVVVNIESTTTIMRQDVFDPVPGQTQFTLLHPPLNQESTELFIDGVSQTVVVDYGLSGQTLTYVGNPVLDGTETVVIKYFEDLSVVGYIGLPEVLYVDNATDGYNIDFVNDSRGINCLDPIDPQDVATKNYVDGYIGSLDLSPVLSVYDEGFLEQTRVDKINFIGPGVTAVGIGSGTVNVTITGSGGGGSGTVMKQELYIAEAGQTIFTVVGNPFNEQSTELFINGVSQTVVLDYNLTDIHEVTYSGNPILLGGEEVVIKYFEDISLVTPPNPSAMKQQVFIAEPGQSLFTVDYNPMNEDSVELFIDGVSQTVRDDYSVTGNVINYYGDVVLDGTEIVVIKYFTMIMITTDPGLPTVLAADNSTDGYNINFENASTGINCIDPTNPQDIATKHYVDGYSQDLEDLINNHSIQHESGGIDEVDGYNIGITYIPENYISPSLNIVGAHIAAMDSKFGDIIAGNVVAISAGSFSRNSGTVAFANSNGVTFGMNTAGVVTASVTGGGAAISAGTNSKNSGTISFVNSNGLSWGMDTAGVITGSVSGGGVAISAGTNSKNSGTVVFSNSNGLSWGMDTAGVITGSVVAGGAAISAGSFSRNSGIISFASNNNGISCGMDSLGLVTWNTTQNSPMTIAIGPNTISGNSVVFSNANGVSFGMATDINGGTITASAVSGVVMGQAVMLHPNVAPALGVSSFSTSGISGTFTNGYLPMGATPFNVPNLCTISSVFIPVVFSEVYGNGSFSNQTRNVTYSCGIYSKSLTNYTQVGTTSWSYAYSCATDTASNTIAIQINNYITSIVSAFGITLSSNLQVALPLGLTLSPGKYLWLTGGRIQCTNSGYTRAGVLSYGAIIVNTTRMNIQEYPCLIGTENITRDAASGVNRYGGFAYSYASQSVMPAFFPQSPSISASIMPYFILG
jgi:hypothetical protein